MVMREVERIEVSGKFSREFERKDRVKSEILERILKEGLVRVYERCRKDECLDGLKGMKMVKSM